MDCKLITTPVHPTCNLSKDNKSSMVDQMEYRGLIHSLLYLTASRPDIFTVYGCVLDSNQILEKLT